MDEIRAPQAADPLVRPVIAVHDRLLHLVGMVGAGKSTIRDILTYHVVTQTPRRVTLVVGDMAETLAVVEQFDRLGVRAAPILGHSTRERNINRLHRRSRYAHRAGARPCGLRLSE
ncbi:hypothetical protein [Streptomyces sp. NPDC005859]